MGLFDRFRRDRLDDPATTASVPGPATTDPPEVSDEEVEDVARSWVLPGFTPREEVVTTVAEVLELTEDDPRARTVVDRVWAERLTAESGWEGTGDFDRVHRAFEALDEQGVLGRMNFTCCQNCGTTEIDDERTALAEVPEGAYPFREWAYTFFHQQDAERLADEPAVLHLSYSAFRPAPGLDPALLTAAREGDRDARTEVTRLTDTAVGTLVADALRGAGLDVEWDGDPGSRVAVRIGAWRKPLPA